MMVITERTETNSNNKMNRLIYCTTHGTLGWSPEPAEAPWAGAAAPGDWAVGPRLETGVAATPCGTVGAAPGGADAAVAPWGAEAAVAPCGVAAVTPWEVVAAAPWGAAGVPWGVVVTPWETAVTPWETAVTPWDSSAGASLCL